MHLFLAPHFDDAVFSCGGTIRRLTAAGERVVVLTVMGGVPAPSRLPDSPAVRELHARWGEGSDPVSVRIREDEEAVTSLGAEAQRLLAWTDCIYRVSRSGGVLYPSFDSIFAAIHPEDPAAKWIPTIVLPLVEQMNFLYAPLGVGQHADHRIVRDWALELKKQNPWLALKFYEEYPYTQVKTAVDQALPYFETCQPPITLLSETVALEEAQVVAKLKAITCYRSQLSSFWESVEVMESRTRQSMIEAGGGQPGERYWVLENQEWR